MEGQNLLPPPFIQEQNHLHGMVGPLLWKDRMGQNSDIAIKKMLSRDAPVSQQQQQQPIENPDSVPLIGPLEKPIPTPGDKVYYLRGRKILNPWMEGQVVSTVCVVVCECISVFV